MMYEGKKIDKDMHNEKNLPRFGRLILSSFIPIAVL